MKKYVIRFPKKTSYAFPQNESVFDLIEGGDFSKIRFHDYNTIYEKPGLYEQLFYERLQCRSPEVVIARLEAALENAGQSLSAMRVLDLGAGNGIVANELRSRGVARIVGLDIIPEALEAALRDHPGAYDDYIVADLARLDARQERALSDWQISCLACVAALGFDDIPARAFFEAIQRISDDGWLAFNIKLDFIDSDSDFARLVKSMLYDNLVELHLIERYWHRLSIDGDWLEYFVIVARKRGPLPAGLAKQFTDQPEDDDLPANGAPAP